MLQKLSVSLAVCAATFHLYTDAKSAEDRPLEIIAALLFLLKQVRQNTPSLAYIES